ncbi:hypothetical protein PHSY_001343 [Pseudozyma hubeiensis SY62]|uniref:Uncharacterized protein n=1 Tax=Pseudozyma hubeiensis (strain SY62) TaxID=1305764 RepID=R9NYD4_PSEHS|nr:hypothetical protein PHSY_001343 [Pseudozyma hubeiensis SY62]GAC93778.1 hypothetical protein PHSY_001343 [Pseudozyma hubeiensis SY62]
MPALVTTTADAAAAADRLILEVSKALSAPAGGTGIAENLSTALTGIQKHARSFGFSSKQCEQLVRLALLGRLRPLSSTGTSSSAKQKPPKSSVSLALLRFVIPKPRARVGRQAVLDIIACLGPSPGADTLKPAGLLRDGSSSAGPSLGPQRLQVDSKVQVAALKLLSVLLESPSVPLSIAANFYSNATDQEAASRSERQRNEREQERLQRHASQYTGLAGNLPTSYLTSAAKTTLEKCYSTLFHYLDYQALRPHLCYLLCRLTKRRHVRHYRITKLMAMRANSAGEAGVSAVLSTYANFYPDLLFPELLGGGGAGSSAIAGGPAASLKYPDCDWIAAVLLAHARCTRRSQGEAVESDDEAEVENEDAGGNRAIKKQRLSSNAVKESAAGDQGAIGSAAPTSIAIPNLVTIQPLNSAQKAFGTHPSLITELSSLRHLAHSLDRLVLPSQAAAMLGSGFGARLMRVAVLAGATVTNEDSLSQTIPAGRRNRQAEQDLCWARLSDWLESVLSDELGVQASSQKRRLKLPSTEAEFKRLAALLRRTRYVFELAEQMPAKLEALTSSVLTAIAQVAAGKEEERSGKEVKTVDDMDGWSERWDQLAKEVLTFVPLVTPCDLASFEERFMAPLDVLATSSKVSLDTSAAALLALSGLLSSWGVRDWAEIGRTLDSRNSYRWGISNLDAGVDYTELISSVSSRTDALAASLVGLYPRHLMMEHASLSVYEALSGPLVGMRATASIPALPLFAFTMHASTIVPVSRLCGLVQDLRSAFEQHNAGVHDAAKVDGGLESKFIELRSRFFEEENLATLNSTVTLVANLVWMGKVILEDDQPGALPAGFDASVLNELTQRGDVLNLKLSTLANSPFSRAMSHVTERFANVYASKGKVKEEGWIRGPITQKTLKGAKKSGMPAAWTHTDFRAYMLDWLDREGANGLYELLKNILVTFGSQLKSIRGEGEAEGR